MTEALTAESLPNELELVMVRHFDAPVGLIWRCWTDPELVARWWGPEGMQSRVDVWDARPGGEVRVSMVGPDGDEHPMTATFEAVEAGRRIVFVGSPLDENGAPYVTSRQIITFHEEKGGTRLENHAHLVADQVIGRPMMQGMDPGYNSSLNRMVALAAAERRPANPPNPMMAPLEQLADEIDVVFSRHFDAPRELVWKAWTDPALLARWWGPDAFESEVQELDARPGGRLYLVMSGMGMSHGMSATFEEVDPPSRLVMTAVAEDDAGQPYLTNRLEITFTEDAGGTRLDAVAHLEAKQPDGRRMIAGMEPGFGQSLERLALVLAS